MEFLLRISKGGTSNCALDREMKVKCDSYIKMRMQLSLAKLWWVNVNHASLDEQKETTHTQQSYNISEHICHLKYQVYGTISVLLNVLCASIKFIMHKCEKT